MIVTSPDPGPWYKISQTAPMVGVCAKTLRTMCAARQIECTVVPGKGRGDHGRDVGHYMLSARQIAAYHQAHTQTVRGARR